MPALTLMDSRVKHASHRNIIKSQRRQCLILLRFTVLIDDLDTAAGLVEFYTMILDNASNIGTIIVAVLSNLAFVPLLFITLGDICFSLPLTQSCHHLCRHQRQHHDYASRDHADDE